MEGDCARPKKVIVNQTSSGGRQSKETKHLEKPVLEIKEWDGGSKIKKKGKNAEWEKGEEGHMGKRLTRE